MGAVKAEVSGTIPAAALGDGPGLPPELAAALTRKTTAEAKLAESKLTVEQLNLENIRSSNDQNRTLVLTGAIIDTEEAVAILMRWGRRDPGKPITIYLNTPGGSVFDGNALVSAIRELRKAGHKVTIHGVGMVMSYGAVLLQAADERILDKDVVFMIHALNAPVAGALESIQDQAKMLQEVQDRLLDALLERATISRTKLKQLTRRKELFLSAADAKKMGFCDRVE